MTPGCNAGDQKQLKPDILKSDIIPTDIIRTDVIHIIEKKEERRIRSLKKKRNAIWFGIGAIGAFGWQVVLPILLGIFIGLWIDNTWHGKLSWTLVLLITGIIIGCFNSWRWIMNQLKAIEKRHKK